MRRVGRRQRRVAAAGAAVAAVLVLVAGCSDGGPSAERFCGRVAADRDALVSGVTGATDVSVAVGRYRDLQQLAPASIREEWRQVTDLVVAAATLDPNDEAGRQRLAEQGIEAQRAVETVATWVRDTCGVELGPLGTLAPVPTAPPGGKPRPTTIAPPPTSSQPATSAATGSPGRATTPPTSARRATTPPTSARRATTTTVPSRTTTTG